MTDLYRRCKEPILDRTLIIMVDQYDWVIRQAWPCGHLIRAERLDELDGGYVVLAEPFEVRH